LPVTDRLQHKLSQQYLHFFSETSGCFRMQLLATTHNLYVLLFLKTYAQKLRTSVYISELIHDYP